MGADPLAIYQISQTIILIRNELHKDITKPIHEYKHTVTGTECKQHIHNRFTH